MINFEAETANDVWLLALERLIDEAKVQTGRDQPTLELLHASFTISDPRQRVVFARNINPAFAIAEVIWIISGGNDVDFLTFWNPRMINFTDPPNVKTFHGAYGHRLGSQPRLSQNASNQLRHPEGSDSYSVDQIHQAYTALMNSPDNRQVVLQIWDHKIDLPNPNPRSKDIPCNIMSHLMIRNNRLEWLQVMRSNDLIWGTPYNFIQFTTLQEIMAGWLGVEIGSFCQVSDSLHVYERHWESINNMLQLKAEVPKNEADLRIVGYAEWEDVWRVVVDLALALTREETSEGLQDIHRAASELPSAYQEWISLLSAEALRRRGYNADAFVVIQATSAFWASSWRQWAQGVISK